MSKKKIMECTGKEETFEPTTLDSIMGFNELSRYNTIDPEQYAQTLLQMNRTDLEAEARRVGAIIVEDNERLVNNLKKEFTYYVSTLKKPKHITRPISLSKEAENILREGR